MNKRMTAIRVWAALLGIVGMGSAANTWTSLGPYGGYARALAIDPSNPAIVYVGTSGGVFKSTDFGASWSAVSTGLPAGYIPRTLALDPRTPSTVYAGGSCGVYGPCGIYKSHDGGASWTAINAGLEDVIFVESLAIDPIDPDVIYAGTQACLEGFCHIAGVFKTTDGGASWGGANSGLPVGDGFSFIGSLVIDPQHPNVVYAASNDGIFKTVDAGVSWNRLRAGGIAVAIDPRNLNTLYATGLGVWKSTNGGASWSAASSGLPKADCCASLAVDPQDPNVVYAALSTAVSTGARMEGAVGPIRACLPGPMPRHSSRLIPGIRA
jgi:photosystem II stability/assembly factor-like uncharacterized protein